MNKKHFFICFHNSGLGGVQRKMFELAEYAAQSGNLVPHLVFRVSNQFSFERSVKLPSNYRIHYEPKWKILRRYQEQLYTLFLLYLVVRYKPTGILVYFHSTLTYYLLVKRVLFWRPPRIVLSQDTVLSVYNQRPFTDHVFTSKQLASLYAYADSIIVQTKYAYQDLVQNFSIQASKISVIPNWTKRTKLQRAPRTIDLIFAGRLSEQKRVDVFLQVVQRLVKKNKMIRAVILGDGPLKNQLMNLSARLNLRSHVQFLPLSTSVGRHLSSAKILLLPSSFEGQPLVVLEAMANGTIPIVSNFPGVGEYISHGKTGFIAPSLADLTQQCEKLLQDDALIQKIQHQALTYIRTNHSETRMQETLNLLLRD